STLPQIRSRDRQCFKNGCTSRVRRDDPASAILWRRSPRCRRNGIVFFQHSQLGSGNLDEAITAVRKNAVTLLGRRFVDRIAIADSETIAPQWHPGQYTTLMATDNKDVLYCGRATIGHGHSDLP